VYEARVAKQASAAEQWVRNTGSLQQLHAWLFDTHMCYAVPRQGEFGQPTGLGKRLLASY